MHKTNADRHVVPQQRFVSCLLLQAARLNYIGLYMCVLRLLSPCVLPSALDTAWSAFIHSNLHEAGEIEAYIPDRTTDS